MTLSLQRVASGDTNYVDKHNANFTLLESVVGAMEATVATLQTGAASPINAINIGKAMFGATAVALIGENSFASSTSGTNLTLQPGFYWSGGTAQMAYKANTTVIAFSGAAAATYYIRMGQDGIPFRDTSSAGALYSVVWNGSAFGTITKLATYAIGYDDLLALLGSDYSGLSYATPDKRLEATEKAFSARLSKTISTADVTLTTAEAMESAVILLTGALTANRNLIVPAKAKVYQVDNDTSGAFTVTVKTTSGTGVAIANGNNATVYCDGTNVVALFNGAGGGGGSTTWTGLSDTPDAYTGQANKIVKVKADESGLEFGTATAPGVFTGLSDVPTSYVGQAGKVPKVNATETGLEFGAAVSTYLALTDTPASYVGQAYRVVSVKGDETGLEFSAAATPSSLLGLTDTPDTYASMALRVLRVNAAGTAIEFTDQVGASTVNSFTDLSDVPTNYAGHALKIVRVNGAASALEFSALDLTTFLGLTDTPNSYAGAAYRVITVKGDESGVEFSSAATPASFIGLTDAPTAYTGHGGKRVVVKANATGLEFEADSFLNLADAPTSYTGQALKGVRVNAGATALEFYDEPVVAAGAWNGTIPANSVVLRFTAPFAVDFQAAIAGSSGMARTTATAQTDFTVKKVAAGTLTETTVGTMRFAAAANAPTFIAASAFSLAVGDALEVIAPATADTTLANISFSLLGTR